MAPGSSSGHGFPSNIRGSNSSLSTGPSGSNGISGSSNSKSSTGEKHTPPAIDASTPGQEGGQISPDEISGLAPELLEQDPMVTAIMMTTERTYVNPDARPMGFRNGKAPRYPSSICYRNSAVTMLLNLPYFTNWLSGGYPSDRPVDVTNPIMDTVQRLAAEYWSEAGPADDSVGLAEAAGAKRRRLDISMDKFWRQFIAARPNFTQKPKKKNFYRQEDAALFLMELLDFAHEELDPISTDATVLRDTFKPWLAGSLYCSGRCQNKRKRQQRDGQPVFEEPSWIHIVNFKSPLIKKRGKRSFEECFDASLKQQQDLYCPTCKRETRRTLKHKFFQLPNILLTQLNRSTNIQGKIQTHCEIPREMTVPVDDSVASKYRNHKYRLVAVVAHSGESSKAGHYISYVHDPLRKGSWIELDDDTVRDIDFEEINNNTGTEQILPYIMAWELITDANEEVDPPETEEQRSRQEIAERARALDEREESLNRQVEELTKQLKEKDLALQRREQELDQKELAPRTPEKTLDEKKKAFTEKERKLTARGVAVFRKAKELGEKQRALDQREGELEERERDLQAKKEVGNSIKDSGMPPEQTEKIKTSIEQDVDSRKDTATFCATFRNADDHEENARAVFKLKNLKLNVPTRIESAVQLSDLEGNLRSIKKGTTITDEFTITFNVKGGKKRKRGDDDEAGSHPRPSPPAKKKKAPARQADQDQTSKVKGDAKTSPKIKNEPQSPKLLENPPQGSPKLRRSTRVNRGRNPRRA